MPSEYACIVLVCMRIHISEIVIFCVRLWRCPFYSDGLTRASESGTGNQYRLSRFFYQSQSQIYLIRRASTVTKQL